MKIVLVIAQGIPVERDVVPDCVLINATVKNAEKIVMVQIVPNFVKATIAGSIVQIIIFSMSQENVYMVTIVQLT